jgi:hypothetical protein
LFEGLGPLLFDSTYSSLLAVAWHAFWIDMANGIYHHLLQVWNLQSSQLELDLRTTL